MSGDLVVSPQEVWKFGTQERVQRGTPLALYARVDGNAAADRRTTFRRHRTTAGYQVTAGRTLIITRALYFATAANPSMDLVDGTDDLGLNSAGTHAGEVLNDAPGGGGGGPLRSEVAQRLYDVPYYVEVPAGRFFSLRLIATAAIVVITVFGVEV